jgi:hypothetical protein
MALAGVSAAYATAGGNQAIAFGEELAEPHRHMGRVILLAGLIGAFATAIPVIAVVVGAGDLPSILKSACTVQRLCLGRCRTGRRARPERSSNCWRSSTR